MRFANTHDIFHGVFDRAHHPGTYLSFLRLVVAGVELASLVRVVRNRPFLFAELLLDRRVGFRGRHIDRNLDRD